MILLIDNYDSFTFNLYQLLSRLGGEVTVVRNDAVSIDEVQSMRPDGIVISPGPGKPDGAGICLDLIEHFKSAVPILGVCLGHQCLGQAFGGRVISAPQLMHGKSSSVYHRGEGVFTGLPSPVDAIRYHSLTLDPEAIPECLSVTARTDTGVVMGLRHREFDVEGVQFHPESVMTREGPQIVANWLRRVGVEVDTQLGEPAQNAAS